MIQKRFSVVKGRIRYNISQVIALAEKNIKLKMRYKYQVLFRYISPIIGILMPLIIFRALFSFNQSFGIWTQENYIIFLLSIYNLNLLKSIISEFPSHLRIEKFWKTLPALIIAPFKRFHLLFGIFLSNLVLISLPFIIILIITYIFYPISLLTFLFILFIYMLIAFIFSGIGLILGVFAISKENMYEFLIFALNYIFWASCLSYPFELFPLIFQNIISLNPLYYIFTFLRMVWVQDNIILTLCQYNIYFLVMLATAIILPVIAVIIFNRIYRRYGITGY